MVKLHDLTTYLDNSFDIKNCPDASNNGLQVEGCTDVEKAVFGVDGCKKLFQTAAEWNADFVFVHHGLSWKSGMKYFTGLNAGRLATLFHNNISLYAAHLPLDKHPELGHNARIAQQLELVDLKPCFEIEGINIGFHGVLSQPLDMQQLIDKVEYTLSAKSFALKEGTNRVEKIGIISGGAPEAIEEAVRLNLDCLVTGEMDHTHFHWPAELGINVIAAGHYKTEVPGIKAVMQLLDEKFDIECRFADLPTGM